VWVPDGVDDAQVRGILREDYSMEIGGGLSKFAGRIWRIGQMGYGCSQRNVLLVLSALRDALLRSGFKAGDGVASASAVYQQG